MDAFKAPKPLPLRPEETGHHEWLPTLSDYLPQPVTHVHKACGECHALVSDLAAHQRWHETQDR